MSDSGFDFERQLRRQSLWLKDSWHWIIENEMLRNEPKGAGMLALDVGCGPGFVMEALRPILQPKGIDSNRDMVLACRSRGLEAVEGSAENLPFDDDSFDLVYCTFLLLWLRKPEAAVAEMARVSRKWIACLAEPDFGGRLSHPRELESLDPLIEEGIRKDGGDPLIGRKLRSVFRSCGLEAKIGVHPGVWNIDRLRAESDDEWKWVEMTTGRDNRDKSLRNAKAIWEDALHNGTLFQFNPIFYAVARKQI
jgi:SAM-dependent methyltransferase